MSSINKLRVWDQKWLLASEVWFAEFSASPVFIIMHLVFWAAWILFGVEEFPYGRLVLIVALETIILGVVNVRSSERQARLDAIAQQRDINQGAEQSEQLDNVARELERILNHLDTIENTIDRLEEQVDNRDESDGYWDDSEY